MSQFEVEQKYYVDDLSALEDQLRSLGAVQQSSQGHVDTYYNHPCRDFAETSEALRIRRIDGQAHVTYKGQKLPGSIKARRELEWPLAPGDANGQKMDDLLRLLGFRVVSAVEKQRRRFVLPDDLSRFSVAIDQVRTLGLFAEIELMVTARAEIDAARRRIEQLGNRLGLHRRESRSYLGLLLGAKKT